MSALRKLAAFLVVATLASPILAADWPTHRGNAQRTGNVDGQAGPTAAKVVWVHKSTEHFIASPVIANNALVLSGFGAFNTSRVYAMSLDATAKDRVLWSKAAPYLKLAVVSSPSSAGDMLVFGDGMHQDSGGVLHALKSSSGLPAWNYAMSGTLVHLESSPTLAAGRVFSGGGNAGVFCVDPNQLTLAGKTVDLATAQAEIEKQWKAAQEKYAEAKKKGDEFAVPPRLEDLPLPQPKLVWQQGLDRWHVDAAVNVAGDRVFAATSFLDQEQKGERAVAALNAKTGDILWTTPTKYNPWGGATVAGELLIVGQSNIRYEPKTIPAGKGEVLALNAADGKEKWKVNLPNGGVVSPVAVAGEFAICTATDGKVRALDLVTGEKRWIYAAHAPFFAGVAIAGDVVYAADLHGVVHALGLKDGSQKWTLNVGADPAVDAPGMIYGSPVVHGGSIYVATCNAESETSKATAVICIGQK